MTVRDPTNPRCHKSSHLCLVAKPVESFLLFLIGVIKSLSTPHTNPPKRHKGKRVCVSPLKTCGFF